MFISMVGLMRGTMTCLQTGTPSCPCHHAPRSPLSPKSAQSCMILTRYTPTPPTATLMHTTLKIIHFCSGFLARIHEPGFYLFLLREWDKGKKPAEEQEEAGSPHILIFWDSQLLSIGLCFKHLSKVGWKKSGVNIICLWMLLFLPVC